MEKNNKRLTILISLLLLGVLITVFAVEDVALTTSEENAEPIVVQTDTEELLVEQGAPLTNSQEVATEQPEPAATIPQEPINETRLPLATMVNGKSIDDDPYVREYLRLNNNFEELAYETVADMASTTMYAGNSVEETVKGFAINDQLYAVHLIICDEEVKACYFRVNGIPTGAFLAKDDAMHDGTTSFDLDEQYTIEIQRLIFNDCGDRRFCDIYWDERDIVELEIKVK